jgi:hypothetical protein
MVIAMHRGALKKIPRFSILITLIMGGAPDNIFKKLFSKPGGGLLFLFGGGF